MQRHPHLTNLDVPPGLQNEFTAQLSNCSISQGIMAYSSAIHPSVAEPTLPADLMNSAVWGVHSQHSPFAHSLAGDIGSAAFPQQNYAGGMAYEYWAAAALSANNMKGGQQFEDCTAVDQEEAKALAKYERNNSEGSTPNPGRVQIRSREPFADTTNLGGSNNKLLSKEFKSEQEKEKYIVRRKKNNEAAKQSRTKRREQEEQLKQRVRELEQENRRLERENGRLAHELAEEKRREHNGANAQIRL